MSVINYRLGNLELRSCDKHLLFSGTEHETLAVVDRLGEGRCIVLACWRSSKGGYDLGFIGDRPFRDSVNSTDFWHLIKIGQEILNAKFYEDICWDNQRNEESLFNRLLENDS